jgi:hypothetical protein
MNKNYRLVREHQNLKARNRALGTALASQKQLTRIANEETHFVFSQLYDAKELIGRLLVTQQMQTENIVLMKDNMQMIFECIQSLEKRSR